MYIFFLKIFLSLLRACRKKLQSNKRICSEVSVNSPAIRGVSREEEEKEGYGGKDLQKRKSLE